MSTKAKAEKTTLSPSMEKAICRWQLRFADLDNPTANALAKRGMIAWAPPQFGWGQVEGRWLLTAKGNEMRASLTKAGATP